MFRKSKLTLGLRYEFNETTPKNKINNIFQTDIYENINGLGKQHLLALTSELDLDFRDHKLFSRFGSQLYFINELFVNFSHDDQLFGQLKGYFAHYESFSFITLALRGGFSQNYGNAPYYHYSALGSNAFMRAHVRNRYLGDRRLYFNSDLRLHLGTIPTPLFPIKWGIYGFYDFGRVWLKEEIDTGGLHRGYGGGIYAAPLSEEFAFLFTIGVPDKDELYFRLSFGFDLQ